GECGAPRRGGAALASTGVVLAAPRVVALTIRACDFGACARAARAARARGPCAATGSPRGGAAAWTTLGPALPGLPIASAVLGVSVTWARIRYAAASSRAAAATRTTSLRLTRRWAMFTFGITSRSWVIRRH